MRLDARAPRARQNRKCICKQWGQTRSFFTSSLFFFLFSTSLPLFFFFLSLSLFVFFSLRAFNHSMLMYAKSLRAIDRSFRSICVRRAFPRDSISLSQSVFTTRRVSIVRFYWNERDPWIGTLNGSKEDSFLWGWNKQAMWLFMQHVTELLG